MKIPKIIHHIAPKDTDRWHSLWERCYLSWSNVFTDFEHKLWNDEDDIDNLVKEFYPNQWEFYSTLPVHIMKIDFARLCILHQYGGIYADMDVFCYKNFYSNLTEDFHITEAPYGEKWANGELKVENCLMCSVKNNTFIENMINNCEENYTLNIKQKFKKDKLSERSHSYLITNTAGPSYVSKKLNDLKIDLNFILSGHLYNNHGLAYDDSFYTKHIMTGLWGKEIIDIIIKDSNQDFNQTTDNLYIQEIKKYAKIEFDTTDQFDFYKDYTDGQFIKEQKEILISEPKNKLANIQYS